MICNFSSVKVEGIRLQKKTLSLYNSFVGYHWGGMKNMKKIITLLSLLMVFASAAIFATPTQPAEASYNEEIALGPVLMGEEIAIEPYTMQFSFNRDVRRGQTAFSQSFIAGDFVSLDIIRTSPGNAGVRIWLERLVNGQWVAVGNTEALGSRFNRSLPATGTYRIGLSLPATSPHSIVNVEASGRIF